mgnify:CR=1 FL=1
MGLVCLIDLQHKGKSYKKGEAIAVDPAKVSVFISKGWAKESGDAFADIDVEVKEIKAKTKTILIAERTALNFLNHTSGIATLTNQFKQKVNKKMMLKATQSILADKFSSVAIIFS